MYFIKCSMYHNNLSDGGSQECTYSFFYHHHCHYLLSQPKSQNFKPRQKKRSCGPNITSPKTHLRPSFVGWILDVQLIVGWECEGQALSLVQQCKTLYSQPLFSFSAFWAKIPTSWFLWVNSYLSPTLQANVLLLLMLAANATLLHRSLTRLGPLRNITRFILVLMRILLEFSLFGVEIYRKCPTFDAIYSRGLIVLQL